MKKKIRNFYLGLPQEVRWDVYKSLSDIDFLLGRDFSLPKEARVLAIDISKMITGIVRKALLSFFDRSTQVDRAHNQKEALQKLKENPNYDLIICSSTIFQGSLFELLRELKAMNYTALFLLHTSMGGSEAYQVVQQTDIDGFILKPRGIVQFAQAMQEPRND